jgi:hypothetical protein
MNPKPGDRPSESKQFAFRGGGRLGFLRQVSSPETIFAIASCSNPRVATQRGWRIGYVASSTWYFDLCHSCGRLVRSITGTTASVFCGVKQRACFACGAAHSLSAAGRQGVSAEFRSPFTRRREECAHATA